MLREDHYALHVGVIDTERLESGIRRDVGLLVTPSWSHWRAYTSTESANHCILLTPEPRDTLLELVNGGIRLEPMRTGDLKGVVAVITKRDDWSHIFDMYTHNTNPLKQLSDATH